MKKHHGTTRKIYKRSERTKVRKWKKLKKEEALKKQYEEEQKEEYKKLINKISKYISGEYLNDDSSECITFDINSRFTKDNYGIEEYHTTLKIDK